MRDHCLKDNEPLRIQEVLSDSGQLDGQSTDKLPADLPSRYIVPALW